MVGPAALAELLRACIAAAVAFRELRAAFNPHHHDDADDDGTIDDHDSTRPA